MKTIATLGSEEKEVILVGSADPVGDDELEPVFRGMFITQKFGISFQEKSWLPPTDIYETEKEMVVKIEISGIRMEEVNITLSQRKLVVRGKRADDCSTSRRTFRQMEINYGSFERVVPLTRPVDADETRARYESGFLVITVPFSKKSSQKAVTIPIKFE